MSIGQSDTADNRRISISNPMDPLGGGIMVCMTSESRWIGYNITSGASEEM